LHSLPDRPDAIPYVTSYYQPRWGFCLSHRQRMALPEGEYQVVVDTEHLANGSMTLSEAVLPGSSASEVLLSTYTCHPSMANNELSGPVVSAYLYRRLAAVPNRRLTYRFVYLAETIGSIAYLSRIGEHLRKHLVAGYVLSCIGDRGAFTYKASRRGDTLADRAARQVIERYSEAPKWRDFSPFGSDERQYCSPGFDLPVGAIARSIYGEFAEYHTSDDNLSFVDAEALGGAVDACFNVCMTLDRNHVPERVDPFCEPQLGRRNLYPTLGTIKLPEYAAAAQWVLNLSDGKHDLIAIAQRSGMDFWLLEETAAACRRAGLLKG
jgi:aminopeptidase-like protein